MCQARRATALQHQIDAGNLTQGEALSSADYLRRWALNEVRSSVTAKYRESWQAEANAALTIINSYAVQS